MPGVLIMAVITSLVGAAIAAGLIMPLSRPEDRKILAVAFLLTLPLSPLVFYVVRVPILAVIDPLLAEGPIQLFVRLLYAPLTEEPAKLLPLLLPVLWRRIDAKNAVPFAVALGAGFGVGEIWLIAGQVAAVPDYATLPFYYFSGFAFERLMVVALHGFFTAAAVRGLKLGYPLGGVLAAFGLHWLGNAPIALRAIDPGGLGDAVWTTLISLWIVLYAVIGVSVVQGWHRGPIPARARSHARCPECGSVYPRPVFVMNTITRRYERCPNCLHWHWIDRWADPDLVPVPPSS